MDHADRVKFWRERARKLEYFIRTVERVYPDTKRLLWRSFLQGVFFSLGTTVGFSLLIALTLYVIRQPVFKGIINQKQIEKIIQRKN